MLLVLSSSLSSPTVLAATGAACVVVVVLVAGVGSSRCCWCRGRGCGPCCQCWQQQVLLVSSSSSSLLAVCGRRDSPWEIDCQVSISHGMFRCRVEPRPRPRLTASQISSPSRGPSEPFLTASHGSGYRGSAWLGLRLQAELFTSLARLLHHYGSMGCR